ncbi:branched-chain amino acid transport system II carrier protein [Streptobacillus felis]|uniref:Branched-chain amino acid transport system II carrier protein n=1 Tax=Streptobacillus felis TaxID=1384509 RepID=A0A7Z0T832_9FUSO|nr:branched-chain amino acid transport system II carrier protein [Streptobacillus felis]NYV27484.1 branched-chain amino acid transport system II carrier protein [Streptobacillus felis]
MKSKKEYIYVSLLIFGMFFGAGNLIFPPFVGKEAGTSVFLAMIGFGITSTAATMLGVYIAFKENIMNVIYSKLGEKFTKLLFIASCCTISVVAVPRAAILPFDMIISEIISNPRLIFIFRLIYIAIFFGLVYYLSYNQSSILSVIGKFLTPLLLVLIFIVTLTTFLTQEISLMSPSIKYATNPIFKGFADGYNTMDTLGGIIVGITVVNIIKKNYNLEKKELYKHGKIGTIIAGLIMFSIYFILSFIGAGLSKHYPNAKNGAVILREIIKLLYGNFGIFVLTLIFFVACLTVCIAILTFTSESNYQAFPKIEYNNWMKFFLLLSLFLSSLSLDGILRVSIPILLISYPPMVLIILLEFFKTNNKIVYRGTMLVLLILNTLTVINSMIIKLPLIGVLLSKLPFYSENFSWLIPTLLVYISLNIFVKIKNIRVV